MLVKAQPGMYPDKWSEVDLAYKMWHKHIHTRPNARSGKGSKGCSCADMRLARHESFLLPYLDLKSLSRGMYRPSSVSC